MAVEGNGAAPVQDAPPGNVTSLRQRLQRLAHPSRGPRGAEQRGHATVGDHPAVGNASDDAVHAPGKWNGVFEVLGVQRVLRADVR